MLITPRFRKGKWENDKSEIRHFDKPYFSIGHVLKTGLVIPSKPKTMRFGDVDGYLDFFANTIVRAAGSSHQDAIAERYVAHVKKSTAPETIPLLLPEVRYSREKKHKYRLDFMVIEPATMQRVGFELSPWSSHGRLVGLRGMSQKEINAKARTNREVELAKLKAYFFEHGISTIIFTDGDLKNPDKVFRTIAKFLRPPAARTQQRAEVMARLRDRS